MGNARAKYCLFSNHINLKKQGLFNPFRNNGKEITYLRGLVFFGRLKGIVITREQTHFSALVSPAEKIAILNSRRVKQKPKNVSASHRLTHVRSPRTFSRVSGSHLSANTRVNAYWSSLSCTLLLQISKFCSCVCILLDLSSFAEMRDHSQSWRKRDFGECFLLW